MTYTSPPPAAERLTLNAALCWKYHDEICQVESRVSLPLFLSCFPHFERRQHKDSPTFCDVSPLISSARLDVDANLM